MKPTKKARVVKPQSKKKIGKPLSKFTKVQSSSTLSKLEDTGKNFYEAGKEVANKGTELLKQISAVPEKGLSEVVKMAIKAEQDAAYGRKVVMILGMILSTLMFLFTRLGQDYGFEDKKYDPKIYLPSGYGRVGGDKSASEFGPKTIQTVKEEFDRIPIYDTIQRESFLNDHGFENWKNWSICLLILLIQLLITVSKPPNTAFGRLPHQR